ncbi:hypothetical protein [Burkholderia ambifaria]|uniref:hypothetical protein n=1 Tax=Burkholderia ambifaria TaxID=152480 RepID=UPI002FE09841
MLTSPTARERLERSLPFMSLASADACELVLAGHLTGLTPLLRAAIQRTGNVIAGKLASNGGISITDLLVMIRSEATTAHPLHLPGGEQDCSNFACTLFEHLYGLLTASHAH